MPFGLGKPDKQPEHEGDSANEEAMENSQSATAAKNEGNGPFPAGQPHAGAHPQERGPEAMVFRPSFLDSDAPDEPAAAAQPPRDDAFFISVTRDSGIETHRFDGPSQAQAFVEQVLEEGVPQEDVAAFSGRRVALKVTRRPIVKLVTNSDD